MTEKIQCWIITWDELYQAVRQLAIKIRESGYTIDLIVAIGRGGYVPGRILSDLLGIKDLTSFKIEHYLGLDKCKTAMVKYPLTADVEDKNILVIDDVTDTGDTFDVALTHIRQCGRVRMLRTAVMVHKEVSHYRPDYFAEKITRWRWVIFPWAVNEDLSVLIGNMQPASMETKHIRELLFSEHGVNVSDQQIEDALLLVKNLPE